MAELTPVILNSAEPGIRPDDVYVAHKAAHDAGTTQRECEWHLSLTNSFPAASPNLLWSTGLREDDGRSQGDDWAELFLALVTLTLGGVVYLSCRTRNTAGDASAWATAIALTISSSEPTAARCLQAT